MIDTNKNLNCWKPNLEPNGRKKTQRRYYYPTRKLAEIGRHQLNKLIGSFVRFSDGTFGEIRGLFPIEDSCFPIEKNGEFVVMIEIYLLEKTEPISIADLDKKYATVIESTTPRVE